MPGHPLEVIDPNGRTQVEPSVVTKGVLQSVSPAPVPSDQDVVMLCQFSGGPADTWKTFRSAGDLQSWHDPYGVARGRVSDDGVRYGKRMFRGGPDIPGCAQIHTFRVGPSTALDAGYAGNAPTVSECELFSEFGSASADGVTLETIDAGAQSKYTSAKFSAATDSTLNTAGGVNCTIKRNINTQGESENVLVNLGVPMSIRVDTAASTTATAQVLLASTNTMIHDAHDTANPNTETDAVDLASALVLAAALKTDYNAHLTQAGVHNANDVTNSIAAAAFVTLVDLDAFLDEFKLDFNKHRTNDSGNYHQIAGSPESDPYRAITYTTDGTLATAVAAVNQAKHHFNAHRRGYSTNRTASLAIVLTGANAGYASKTFTFSESGLDTVGGLVDAINATNGYHAKLYPGADPSFPTVRLDVWDSAVSVRSDTAYSYLPSLLSHPVWEMNNKAGQWVSATEVDGLFGNVAGNEGYDKPTLATQFAGGADPTVAAADYGDALDELAKIDIEVIGGGHLFVDTTNATVRASVLDFIQADKLANNRQWRVVFGLANTPSGGLSAGKVPGTATKYAYVPSDAEIDAVATEAALVNGLYAGAAYQRIVDYDEDGDEHVYGPLDMAAIMTGMSAGTRKTRPLSGLAIRALTVIDQPSKTQREVLLKAGAPTVIIKNRLPRINMMVTTRQSTKRMERIWSEVAAAIYMERGLYLAIKDLVPRWGGQALVNKAKANARRVFQREADDVVPEDGVALLSSGTDSEGNALPAYDGIDATAYGGVLRVYGNGYIAGEVDHVFGTIRMEYQTFGVSLPIA